jgi:hypothetical protein
VQPIEKPTSQNLFAEVAQARQRVEAADSEQVGEAEAEPDCRHDPD